MERTWAIGILLTLAAGCGGRQMLLQPPDGTDAGTSQEATIGPVDLSQAPAQLSMTCDNGVGTLTFENPCLVGHNIVGGGSDIGVHEVECTLALPGHGVAWSFLLQLLPIAQNPDAPVTFFPVGPSGGLDLGGGVQAHVSNVTGALTFMRVDPTNRAFAGEFSGVITWIEPSGATFSCSVDGPLWGAPGGFT